MFTMKIDLTQNQEYNKSNNEIITNLNYFTNTKDGVALKDDNIRPLKIIYLVLRPCFVKINEGKLHLSYKLCAQFCIIMLIWQIIMKHI